VNDELFDLKLTTAGQAFKPIKLEALEGAGLIDDLSDEKKAEIEERLRTQTEELMRKLMKGGAYEVVFDGGAPDRNEIEADLGESVTAAEAEEIQRMIEEEEREEDAHRWTGKLEYP
jgi:hypothetical protein